MYVEVGELESPISLINGKTQEVADSIGDDQQSPKHTHQLSLFDALTTRVWVEHWTCQTSLRSNESG